MHGETSFHTLSAKVADSNGNRDLYFWTGSTAAPGTPTILGFPIEEVNDGKIIYQYTRLS